MNIRTFKDEDADVGELEFESLRVGGLEGWSAYRILETNAGEFLARRICSFQIKTDAYSVYAHLTAGAVRCIPGYWVIKFLKLNRQTCLF